MADKSSILDKQGFMDRVRALLQATPGITITGEIEFGFELQVSNSDWQSKVSLDNMYEAYRSDPHCLAEMVDSYVHSIREMANETDSSSLEERLFPCLAPKSCQWETDKSSLIVFDYNEELEFLIVEDFGHSLRFVPNTSLEEWGMSREIVEAVALHNLARSTEQLWRKATKQAQEIRAFIFAQTDNHDASRILLPDFAERACELLRCSEVAVVVPVRDFLMAVPADDSARMDSAAKTAARYYEEGPYSLTPNFIFLKKPQGPSIPGLS